MKTLRQYVYCAEQTTLRLVYGQQYRVSIRTQNSVSKNPKVTGKFKKYLKKRIQNQKSRKRKQKSFKARLRKSQKNQKNPQTENPKKSK